MVPGNLFSRFYRLRFLGFPFWIKARQKKIPERSEDDFFPVNLPAGLPCAFSPANGYLCGKKWKCVIRFAISAFPVGAFRLSFAAFFLPPVHFLFLF